jgi:cytochrome c553
VALAAAVPAAIVGLSESRLRAVDPGPAGAWASRTLRADSASIERGRHIARTRGCFGCHGQQLEGQVWYWVKRAVAPNLARTARDHSPAALEAAIRRGVGLDGRALWSMPSYNFVHLSDDDVLDLISFLATAPIVEVPLPRPSMGLKARWSLLTGAERHGVDWVADAAPLITTEADDPALVRGEYLAMTTCIECHGMDLRGSWFEDDIAPPDLAVVAGYSWEAFERLTTEGVSQDGRTDLGLMTTVAQDRFAHFTEAERRDLYAFLTSLPGRPVARGVPWRPTPPP